MAFLTSYWLTDLLLIVISYVLYLYLKFHTYDRYYWKRRNVPYVEPTFILDFSSKRKNELSPSELIYDTYLKRGDKKLIGIWSLGKPALLVNDLEYIKIVLAKNFPNFHDRGIYVDEEKEPLTGHLFNMNGQRWRNLRVKLTPTFTSGKMKMMYPTMLECGKELQDYLEKFAENNEMIDIKEILACFTTDIISSCAFGIQTNSLKNPDAEFRKYGKEIFKTDNLSFRIVLGLFNTKFSFLLHYLPVRRFSKELTNFFMNAVRETIEYRQSNNIQRKDFMDLMIQIKNKGYIDSADHDTKKEGDKFTFEQITAQAFVFFAAGFETSSTTMQYSFYELAVNPDIQKKLQEEIDRVIKKHNNEITYEAIQEMDYLDGVVNETLRKYPPIPVLFRKCNQDFKFPGTDMTVSKGNRVMISVRGVQNDPKYYPNPDKFDPDRFSPEEKAKRDRFLHLPFGEGPRMCIGNRFGLMQSKTGLVCVLSKYNVSVCEKTEIPLKYDPKSFIVLSPINDIYLKISKRHQK